MANPITLSVALEVASHEAIIRQAYKDSVKKWTWSVGLTSATGHDVERYIGKPQTLEHCLRVFIWALDNYADDVRSKFKEYGLTEAQFAAAVSFHWNTGSIREASWVNQVIAGDIEKARLSFMEWRKPPEIIERREKERDLFFDGVWTNDGTMAEYTKLTKSHTPVWASRVSIEVTDLLSKIILEHNGLAAPIVIAPPVAQPQPPEIVTPEWTAAEHLANIRASTDALSQLL